jgi:Tol biopolymer transport system component
MRVDGFVARLLAASLLVTGLLACSESRAASARAGQGGAASTVSPAERAALPGEIVVAAEHDGHLSLFAVDPADGAARLVAAVPGRDLYPAPGGALAIAVAGETEADHVEQLVRLDAASATPVGPPAGRVRAPRLSSDGAFAVFDADRESFRDLYRLELTGPAAGTLTRLTANDEGNFEPSLSPDGTQVVFTSSRDGDSEIYTMPVGGGAATRLTAFHRDDWGPEWSPDGRFVAFLSDRDGVDRVHVMRPDGTAPYRVGTPVADGGAEDEPVWSSDGRWLAFTRREPDGTSAVHVVRAVGGPVRRLSPPGVRDSQPTWSPDGRALVLVTRERGRDRLVLVRADGTGRTALAPELRAPRLPRWRATPAR